MDVGPSLVADGQAAKAVEPSQRALDDPTVAAQTLAAVEAAPGAAGDNAAAA